MSLQNILHCISKNGVWFKIAFSSLEIQNEINYPMKKNTQKNPANENMHFSKKTTYISCVAKDWGLADKAKILSLAKT